MSARLTGRRLVLALSTVPPLFTASAAHGEEADATIAPTLAVATTIRPNCLAGRCDYRLSVEQLLALAQRLVSQKKFDEARPLVLALRGAPGMSVPYNFLDGLIAMETGDPRTAANRFRAILEDRPGESRVRLELARALIAQGNLAAADYHLRLAQHDDELPEDVSRTVRQVRSILRSNRDWQFGFDFGLAPDTNINSATNAETVDANFGPAVGVLPITLDQQSRARSGTGQTASVFGSLRLPIAESTSIVADVDGSAINYRGKDADDFSVQFAAGPEWRFGNATSLSVQGLGSYRWYGGQVAARQFGGKLTVQHNLTSGQRVGLQLDGRHTGSDFGEAYAGWQFGAAATYEHVIGKSTLASASLFVRRDAMKVAYNASSTAGVSLGIGGELPLGINAGISGSASYSRYDAADFRFSFDRRADWRYQARVYAGLRQVRVYGFSPSVEYRYAEVDTGYDLYRSTRHRVHFKLARYF